MTKPNTVLENVTEARAALRTIVGENRPFRLAGVAMIPWRSNGVREAAITVAGFEALQLEGGMAVFVA